MTKNSFPRLTKTLQARRCRQDDGLPSSAQAGLNLTMKSFSLILQGTSQTTEACKIRLFPQPELGCRGPKSISLSHPIARPVLKWKSTVLYRPAPSLPRGCDNQTGQIRSHKASHFVKVDFFHTLRRMARTYSLPSSDSVLILTSSQHILEAQIYLPGIYNSAQFWRIHKSWVLTTVNSSPILFQSPSTSTLMKQPQVLCFQYRQKE